MAAPPTIAPDEVDLSRPYTSTSVPEMLPAVASIADYWPQPARISPYQAVVPLALACGGGLALVTFDAPLSYYLMNNALPGVLRELFRAIEPFGNGVGVMLIAWAIFQLDPTRRATLPRLIAVSLGAGGFASLVKLFVARHRPATLRFEVEHVFVGFGDHIRLLAESSANAFPSGHTATAVALAIAISTIYPRGRTFFAFAAVALGCQRIAYGSHFASDVCVGGLIGWATAFFGCWYPPTARRLTALERLLMPVRRPRSPGPRVPRPHFRDPVPQDAV